MLYRISMCMANVQCPESDPTFSAISTMQFWRSLARNLTPNSHSVFLVRDLTKGRSGHTQRTTARAGAFQNYTP